VRRAVRDQLLRERLPRLEEVAVTLLERREGLGQGTHGVPGRQPALGVVRAGRPKLRTRWRVRGLKTILEQNLFGPQVRRERVKHRGKHAVIALRLNNLCATDSQQARE